jgi:hypothetical protein
MAYVRRAVNPSACPYHAMVSFLNAAVRENNVSKFLDVRSKGDRVVEYSSNGTRFAIIEAVKIGVSVSLGYIKTIDSDDVERRAVKKSSGWGSDSFVLIADPDDERS